MFILVPFEFVIHLALLIPDVSITDRRPTYKHPLVKPTGLTWPYVPYATHLTPVLSLWQNGKHDEGWMILKQVHDTNMRAKGFPEKVFSVSIPTLRLVQFLFFFQGLKFLPTSTFYVFVSLPLLYHSNTWP